MRKRIVFLGLVLLALCGHAMAETAYITGGNLRLRAAPSRQAETLGVFYPGVAVEILEDAGDGFVSVQIGEGRGAAVGYMAREFLTGSGDAEGGRPAEVASPYGTMTVMLRSRPSNSFEALQALMVGTKVRKLGEKDGAFFCISLENGEAGWLSAEELR